MKLNEIKIKTSQLLLKLFLGTFKNLYAAAKPIKNIIRFLWIILITIFSGILCSYLAYKGIKIYNGNESHYSAFFIAIGSTLITILILTFSISLFPIQRSIESFSKSISLIYRNDKVNSMIFIIISLFSLLSFLFSININFISATISQLLIFEIFIIGITLDLLRWYHRRIARLLEPDFAIKALVKKISSFINKYKWWISLLSKWSYRFTHKTSREKLTIQDYEKSFYIIFARIDNNINSKIAELAEIAIKALSKNENNTVAISLDALADAGVYFVTSRKGYLVYYPSESANYLVSESNIDTVLNKLYENILAVSQRSNIILDQVSSINCLNALAKITNSMSDNLLSKEEYQSKDLFVLPISYISNIIKDAQNNNLDEVVLSGCNILSLTLSKIYDKQHIIEIDYATNELYTNLVLKYIASNKRAFGNKVLESMLNNLFILINKSSYNLNYTLKDIIRKLYSLFPFALISSRQGQNNLMYFDLSVPYDATSKFSFINFIRSAQVLNKPDEKKSFVNPYHHFSDYNDEISMHFRHLAEHNDLGESVFLWHITFSIKEIIRIHIHLLKNPLTEIHNHIEELFDRITWYLSFFWVATGKAEKINKNYVEEICDVICWTALQCYREDFYTKHIIDVHKVIDICISNLSAVIRDYGKKGVSKNPYDIADLLIYLWMIRIVAASRNEKFRIGKIDKALNELDIYSRREGLLDEAIELRYRQFLERTLDDKHFLRHDFDKSVGILMEIVKDKSFFLEV